MAQDIYQCAPGRNTRGEVNALGRSVRLLHPCLDLLVGRHDRVARIERVDKRRHEVVDRIVDGRCILIEREVLDLRAEIRVYQAAILQVRREIIVLESAGTTCLVKTSRVILSRSACIRKDKVDCSPWQKEDGLIALS